MLVKDVMTTDVKCCNAESDLTTAAGIMWECDCGVVPVVNEASGELVGVLTDRDIAIAAATRRMGPQNIRVADVVSGHLYTGNPNDDIREAMRTMRDQRVRRIPIVDQDRHLVGILSMNDLVRVADGRRGAEVPVDVVLDTLKTISAHQHAFTAA
jgi:CBS domain-containing protein